MRTLFSSVILLTLFQLPANAQQSPDVFDCIRNSANMSEMMACTDTYIDHWQSEMQRNYQRLHAVLPEARQIMLEESQEMWNMYRIQHGDLSNAIHFGSGSDTDRLSGRIRIGLMYMNRNTQLQELYEITIDTF